MTHTTSGPPVLRLDRRTITKHWMTWSFVIRVKKLNKSSSCWVHYARVSWTGTHSLSFLTLITKLQSFSAFCDIPQPTILVKNLETLVSISPSPMLIWVSQWSQCFKICVAQHWGGRRHISGGKTVWSINLMIFPENSRETVSVQRFVTSIVAVPKSWEKELQMDQPFQWILTRLISQKSCPYIVVSLDSFWQLSI